MSATLGDVHWPVRTTRCMLRRPTPEDGHAVWSYRHLPEVSRWMSSFVEDEAPFVEGFPSEAQWESMIIVEFNGRVIGDLRVSIEDGWSEAAVAHLARGVQAEVGWVFDPEFHGRGLATEAASRMIDLCFESLGLRRVTAGCFAENEPSWRMMDRMGLRCEGAFTADSLSHDGRWMDSHSYAILRDEWAGIREAQREEL